MAKYLMRFLTVALLGCFPLGCFDFSLSKRSTDTVGDSSNDRASDTVLKDTMSDTESLTDLDTGTDTLPDSPCYQKTCESLSPTCAGSSSQLKSFTNSHFCEDDGNGDPVCTYTNNTISCGADGCDAKTNRCVGDPCLGVVCDLPPVPFECANEKQLTTYAMPSVCDENGECQYTKKTVDCAEACKVSDDGKAACVNEPCKGVDCVNPPARFCAEGYLFSPDTEGTCDNGVCVYDYSREESTDCVL